MNFDYSGNTLKFQSNKYNLEIESGHLSESITDIAYVANYEIKNDIHEVIHSGETFFKVVKGEVIYLELPANEAQILIESGISKLTQNILNAL